jgi:hypothetical protein
MDHLQTWKTIKCPVYFNCVEVFAIELKPEFSGQCSRVKTSFPVLIGKTGATNVDFCFHLTNSASATSVLQDLCPLF